ncbi:DUF58 domain-containing protein [Natronococcus pandeyae]|uniref:DUF58 domain-containing protein n=1 Tax=Natronococcus pandeyae TaxID=2055836 RepID=A0A8J8Q214_9EURY|nr:DUF58 domain-containing protein [Natronococcus pandeyae]TYL37862.1 DUF58 domain-containing protein [Natronococcus pandeyae]
MRPTRQLWGVGILAAVLAGLAAVFARPLLLGATVLIGAWLLTRQYLFVTTVRKAKASLTATQALDTSATRVDDATPVTLNVSLERPRSLSLSLEAGIPPAGVVADPLVVSLAPNETTAQQTTTVSWPVAGRHQFEQATLTATDGLFETTVPVGSTPGITVEPRSPRSVYIGKGGDRRAITRGEHEAERFGSGTDPAEIREYVPGDTADKIDWKATARLNALHVREFEADTDRPTMLIVDHRAALSEGPPAESKLAYLREAALATVSRARQLGDPIGLLSIGDAGLTSRFDPATGPGQYVSIRRQLLDLEPTNANERSGSTDDSTGPVTIEETATSSLIAAGRRPNHASLDTTASPGATPADTDRSDAFVRTLEPFYANQQYQTRFESDPLLGAVRTAAATYHDRVWTIICTDDSDPNALYEAVRYSRSKNNDVLVLLTPSVLFRPSGVADVERAYNQYQSFEEFRQKLDRLEGVTALEVAPEERLSTLLAVGHERTQRQGVRQ